MESFQIGDDKPIVFTEKCLQVGMDPKHVVAVDHSNPSAARGTARPWPREELLFQRTEAKAWRHDLRT